MKHKDLPITEELDFHYLLGLMPALKGVAGFQWLPELFSIVGYDSLILLCKFAGGEVIQIPTLEELSDCVDGLQWFYDVYIKRTKRKSEIPDSLRPLVEKIQEIYHAETCEANNH